MNNHDNGQHCPAPDQPVAVPYEGLDWSDLMFCNDPDVSTFTCCEIMVSLGLHPIVLAGVLPDGTCTCGKLHEVKKRLDGSLSSSIGKHPIHNGWQTAELDLEEIREALIRQPLLNIGLRMGIQRDGSNLITVDVDGDISLLSPLERDEIVFPETLTAKTARGSHLVYRWPRGKALPPNSSSLIADHVDIRSQGGQIVVAPSVHFAGVRYRWERCIEPVVLR